MSSLQFLGYVTLPSTYSSAIEVRESVLQACGVVDEDSIKLAYPNMYGHNRLTLLSNLDRPTGWRTGMRFVVWRDTVVEPDGGSPSMDQSNGIPNRIHDCFSKIGFSTVVRFTDPGGDSLVHELRVDTSETV